MRFHVVAVVLAMGCVIEAPTSELESEVEVANKLAANKLAANKLAANKLAANKLAANGLPSTEVTALAATADGREVLSYIVECALPAGTDLVVGGIRYPGWIGLASAWLTRVPTVAERRWVTGCLLARTNLTGVSIPISMRGPTAALVTTQAERTIYKTPEGAFYGDLFAPAGPQLYACATQAWNKQLESNPARACALSSNGATTLCGFTYTGICANAYAGRPAACTHRVYPFSGCAGGGVSYGEVVTILLN